MEAAAQVWADSRRFWHCSIMLLQEHGISLELQLGQRWDMTF